MMLIVAFVAGIVVPAAQAGSQHHSPTITTVSVSMADAGGCVHDGCPIGQQADMHGTCFAPCTGTTALPPAMAMVQLVVARDVLTPSLDLAVVDRTVAPDPHPPKHTV